MAGHSHWAGIKHKKGTTDQKRGQLFSKLLSAVSAAAKSESNPQLNARLQATVERAKEYKVPHDNIDRAIRRASEDKDLEELILEAYGPEGIALLIEAITTSKNRTIADIKKILADHGGKWAEPGSVTWAFDQIRAEEGVAWKEKFPQHVSESARARINELIHALVGHDDVQEVYTNTSS